MKLAGRSVFGMWWVQLGVLELDLGSWFYFAIGAGLPAGPFLWFMAGRSPEDRRNGLGRRGPRFQLVPRWQV